MVTPEQERLVVDTLPITRRVAEAFVRRMPAGSDGDAIRGAAMEGLVKAAGRFKGGPTWDGYCRQKVLGAMLDEARHQDHARNRSTTAERNRVVMLTVELPAGDVAANRDQYAQARARLDLLEALRWIPRRHRFVVMATVVVGVPCKDVARQLGVDPTVVSRLRGEAFRALRPRLA
jgi:RNA polymerase sigma factor (sigma-70 family)